MAGVKGRSGGARPNTGGARPNSGPKPRPKTTAIGTALAESVVTQAAKPAPLAKPKATVAVKPAPAPKQPAPIALPVPEARIAPPPTAADIMPLDWMLAVMRNPMVDDKLRMEAAKAAAMYCHLKKGDGGIKDEKAEKAKKAGQGKFAAAPAPLRMVK